MVQSTRRFILWALFVFIPMYGWSLSFEWHKGGQTYNSNSIENFEKFYQKFLSIPENKGLVEAFQQLPISFMGAVVDTEWAIGILHTWNKFINGLLPGQSPSVLTMFFDNPFKGILRENYYYANTNQVSEFLPEHSIDFVMVKTQRPFEAVIHWKYPIIPEPDRPKSFGRTREERDKWFQDRGIPFRFLVPPIRRYHGTDLNNKEIFLISDAVHDANGGLIAHNTQINQGKRRLTFARCRLATGQNPKSSYYGNDE